MNKLKLILASLIVISYVWIQFVREKNVIEIPREINAITLYNRGIFIIIAISLVFHLYTIYVLYFSPINFISDNKYISFAKIKVYITYNNKK